MPGEVDPDVQGEPTPFDAAEHLVLSGLAPDREIDLGDIRITRLATPGRRAVAIFDTDDELLDVIRSENIVSAAKFAAYLGFMIEAQQQDEDVDLSSSGAPGVGFQ